MTAPPGASDETPADTFHTPEEPSTTAFGLLTRAQAIADLLRTETEAEVATMRAGAEAAQDEARRLLIDASSVHDDALSAQRSALARLQEAREEAAQLVADAADQATLVADAADRTTPARCADIARRHFPDLIRLMLTCDNAKLRVLANANLGELVV